MIPEYKYGTISLIGFLAILFYNYIPFIDGVGELYYSMFSWYGPVLIMLGLSCIAYFRYGYKRIHNTVTMTDYKITAFFVPNKRKIIFSVSFFLIVCFMLFLIDTLTGIGIKMNPGVYGVFGQQNRVIPLELLLFFGVLLALPAYYLSSFLMNSWSKPKGKKFLKVIIIIFIVLLLFASYLFSNLKRDVADLGNGLALIREGNYEEGQKVCDKATRWVPFFNSETRGPEICTTTVKALKQENNKQ